MSFLLFYFESRGINGFKNKQGKNASEKVGNCWPTEIGIRKLSHKNEKIGSEVIN